MSEATFDVPAETPGSVARSLLKRAEQLAHAHSVQADRDVASAQVYALLELVDAIRSLKS